MDAARRRGQVHQAGLVFPQRLTESAVARDAFLAAAVAASEQSTSRNCKRPDLKQGRCGFPTLFV
jgi:hypothetical protein